MIIMETEKAFGLSISNEDAARMQTPGDIISWVAARVPLDPDPACLSLATFNDLRRALAAVTGLPRHRFAPRTSLASFASRDAWPGIWAGVRRIARASDWPDIQWTRFIFRTPGTLRGIVEAILMGRFDAPPANGRWTRSAIEFTVRRIILRETGRSDYRLSARLVGDLGVA